MGKYVSRLTRNLKGMVASEKGQGLVEYALILVLIAVVVITALTTLGTKTASTISKVGSTLNP